MTDTKSPPGPLALGAALAIIKALGSLQPLRHRADPVTAGELAEVIQGEMNVTVMRRAIEEAMAEIECCHGDMLTEEARGEQAASDWARVYDKLAAARDLLKGGAA